ncbi:hypothetical protein [Nocardioides insulae]|uniref:hypothetical protein n=1 Tax=Nocardioides insulae TaxID=394734 RepID=UPI00040DF921|nr:hypothetical protein [Nocardioides insulae]
MVAIIIVMFVIVALAGLVLLYVAFPHRGEETPGAQWLGNGIVRVVDTVKSVLPQVDQEPRTAERRDHEDAVRR